jgi:hypothetical protein
MKKLLLLCPAIIAALAFTSCTEDRYGSYDDEPAVYGGRSASVDFYYTSGRPYSRSYGPLYYRDDRYYYSRGGGYVAYDQPTYAYRGSDTRIVRNNTNIRNVTVNNRTNVTRNQVNRYDNTQEVYRRNTSAGVTRRDVSTRNAYRDDRPYREDRPVYSGSSQAYRSGARSSAYREDVQPAGRRSAQVQENRGRGRGNAYGQRKRDEEGGTTIEVAPRQGRRVGGQTTVVY